MLSKIKAYVFITVAFISTALAVVFRFQLLKDKAKTSEVKAALAKEEVIKVRAENKLRRETIKRIHEMEKLQQEDLERILEASKRDYFARKQAK